MTLIYFIYTFSLVRSLQSPAAEGVPAIPSVVVVVTRQHRPDFFHQVLDAAQFLKF
ncbi:MAG: hypothetical protein MK171_08380 [Pirellulales bacterium]|nr:hypothetical protein [Pirellulales bacterium]